MKRNIIIIVTISLMSAVLYFSKDRVKDTINRDVLETKPNVPEQIPTNLPESENKKEIENTVDFKRVFGDLDRQDELCDKKANILLSEIDYFRADDDLDGINKPDILFRLIGDLYRKSLTSETADFYFKRFNELIYKKSSFNPSKLEKLFNKIGSSCRNESVLAFLVTVKKISSMKKYKWNEEGRKKLLKVHLENVQMLIDQRYDSETILFSKNVLADHLNELDKDNTFESIRSDLEKIEIQTIEDLAIFEKNNKDINRDNFHYRTLFESLKLINEDLKNIIIRTQNLL